MAEENDKDIEMGSDDLSVLRVLMHNIKGISPVSTTEINAASYFDDEVTSLE